MFCFLEGVYRGSRKGSTGTNSLRKSYFSSLKRYAQETRAADEKIPWGKRAGGGRRSGHKIVGGGAHKKGGERKR